MTAPLASIIIHKFVTTVGPYVGLASILAVAILILLYFAHARETATLRDRLEDAHLRIGGLEQRIAQLMHSQAAAAQRVRAPGAAGSGAVPGAVTPAPAPALARPAGTPIPSVRRIPNPVTAAASGVAATASRRLTAIPAAPAGTAAPALASATKLIPDAEVAGNGSADDTVLVPATAATAAGAAGNGQTAPERAAALSSATQAMPVAAAAARTPSASPSGAVATPPRVQIGGAEPAAAGFSGDLGDAGGSGESGRRVRRIGGLQQGPPASPTLLGEALEQPEHGRRLAGRVLPLLIGVIAIGVIVAGLIVITNSNSGSKTGQVSHHNSNPTGASLENQHKQAAPFKASSYKVAVLNGTDQAGLAGDVGTKLAHSGYRKGNITNAASQTHGRTFVYYVTGKRKATQANKLAAQHVAKALKLSSSRVRPAGQSVKQSCGISATGASLGACSADVIVSVGQDRVGLATG